MSDEEETTSLLPADHRSTPCLLPLLYLTIYATSHQFCNPKAQTNRMVAGPRGCRHPTRIMFFAFFVGLFLLHCHYLEVFFQSARNKTIKTIKIVASTQYLGLLRDFGTHFCVCQNLNKVFFLFPQVSFFNPDTFYTPLLRCMHPCKTKTNVFVQLSLLLICPS